MTRPSQSQRTRRQLGFRTLGFAALMGLSCTASIQPGSTGSGTGSVTGGGINGGGGGSTTAGTGATAGGGTGATNGSGGTGVITGGGTGAVTGSGGAGIGTGGATTVACTAGALSDPGPAISRRLTRTEYNNTVRDLLGDTTAPATDFPAEELSLNFDNSPRVLTISPLLTEGYMNAAETLAANYVKNLSTSLPCSTTGGTSCAQQFIQTFGAKAFRRPIAADDLTRYMTVFNVGATTNFTTGIRLVVTAMLQAAPFLYRVETGGAVVAGSTFVKVTSWEMASRLSYLLWKSIPDDMLTTAAQNDQLQTVAQIATQAERMLGDTKARAAIVDFHDQWLNLRQLGDAQKDAKVFATFTDAINADMRTEATQLISDVLFNGTGDFSGLFTASYTFANANLAGFYGITGITGTTFQKITSQPARHAGILTSGALMSILAKEDQTSPPRRGVFMRHQILCEHIPPPPMNVLITLPQLDPSLTTRQRFSQHATDPSCAACHQYMDTMGLSFENFDAVGRWRDTENGKAIDATGSVTALGGTDPGLVGPYNGIPELGRKLAASPQVRGCFVTNWFRYGTGRAETVADACALASLNTQFGANGYNVKKLIVALAQSDAFRYRRPLTDPVDPSIGK